MKLTILSHNVAPKNTNVRINSPVRFYKKFCTKHAANLLGKQNVRLKSLEKYTEHVADFFIKFCIVCRSVNSLIKA